MTDKAKKSGLPLPLLVIGYGLAVPPLFSIRKLLAKPTEGRASLWLLAEFAGATIISAVWFSRNNKIGGLINLIWAIIFVGLWARSAQKSK